MDCHEMYLDDLHKHPGSPQWTPIINGILRSSTDTDDNVLSVMLSSEYK